MLVILAVAIGSGQYDTFFVLLLRFDYYKYNYRLSVHQFKCGLKL